jgi:hypothetical protein
VIDESFFVPTEWETFPSRVIRKIFRRFMVQELRQRGSRLLKLFRPDVLFVFKGNYVNSALIDEARAAGVLTVNYYPDVSFMTHGKELPQTLPQYDHVFNAKTFGIADMRAHGIRSVSFLAPGFDPEVHRPMTLTESDRKHFGCDVTFIGTWSPKKEKLLATLKQSVPSLHMRIWGNQWEKRATRALDGSVMGMGVTGDDYARAICAARISLGILSEARTGSSSGDLITARTFQIPACGAFMLHERNAEVLEYFEENRDAGFFSGSDELVTQVQRFLADDSLRTAIAASGRKRSVESDYSADRRMTDMVEWIRAQRLEKRTGS